MNQAEILNDFRRRYEGTYVFVKEPDGGESNLFHLDRVEENDEKTGVFHLRSEEIGKIKLNFGSAHTIKFVPAPVGVFQYKTDAHVCQRNPIRQYRRGICSDNTFILPVFYSLYEGLNLGWSFEMVQAAFDAKVFTFKDGLELLNTGKMRSVALHDNFALCLSLNENSPDYILLHWNVPIARVNNAGKVTQHLEGAFTTQVNALVEV